MVVISEGLGIIDADTLPVREPHPMEAWAPEPVMPGEQRGRAYCQEAATSPRRAPRWRTGRRPRHRFVATTSSWHASEIAARQRAEEERREAERKAGPDP
jgi:hypothetical protein